MQSTGTFFSVQAVRSGLCRIAFCLLAVMPLHGCLERSEPISPKTMLPLPGLNSSVSNLTINKIDGMSAQNARKLRTYLKIELAKQRISLVSPPRKAAFSLKGYGSVSADSRSATLINIWDVHDVKGRRIHRIISEASGPGSQAADPWAAVNSTLLAQSARNLARQYYSWSRGKKLTAPLRTARPAAPNARLSTAAIPLRRANSRPNATSKPRIASKPRPAKASVAARFTGAPGNGNAELARALKAALNKNGYRMSSASGQASYLLAVNTYLGPPESGRQSVAIDWIVKNRNGRAIGTIKQRNHVKAGALDRNWGVAARSAANAAANGIIKLLE